MQCILSEDLVPFTHGRVLPGKPSRASLRNWASRGVRSWKTGKTVLLEACYVGQRKHTSVQAYQRFLEAINQPLCAVP